jgi:hypothetical protein
MPATPSSGCGAEPLHSLLQEAHAGAIQIPEFQRDSILRDDWAKSLLASVSLGYPIGALMLLEAGDPSTRFASRPLTSDRSMRRAPELLLVDGRQRLTCLYDVLASNRSVSTVDDHDELIQRWYYLDMSTSLDPDADRDEAVLSATEAGRLRSPEGAVLDVSTVELEWRNRLFPLRLVFGSPDERQRWQRGFTGHGAGDEMHSRGELLDRFHSEVLQAFDQYVVPTIVLGQETARWSVRVHGGPGGRVLSDRFRVVNDTEA